MKRRFKNDEEAIKALRQEPEFRALVEDLKTMNQEDKDRFQDFLKAEVKEEESNGCDAGYKDSNADDA